MKSTIIQAIIFSITTHLIIVGGGFAYLEYLKRQELKQGITSHYGFEVVGGSIASLLFMTFIGLILLYVVAKWIISLFR